MKANEKEDTIIIIGGGFAGLAAGIYGQMNGYKTKVFEMHSLPGGLCTAWKRKGFTIDGCIHWLVGSSPESGMYQLWEETGIARDRQFVNMDEYMRYETADGRTLIFYCDVDRLEKHLLGFSPQDAAPIREFISGIRMCLPFEQPSRYDSLWVRVKKLLKLGFTFIAKGRTMKKWMQTTAAEFSDRFQDKDLRRALLEMWVPEFSMFFMLFTFAYLHKKNAGYPVGGSLPMSEALAKRYLQLGGTIQYNAKVDRILTEDGLAVGIKTIDGSEHRAGRVVSAADGYQALFRMLGPEHVDEVTKKPYSEWKTFPALIYAGIGVNRTFDEEPCSVSGFSFALDEPVEIGDSVKDRLWVHIFNHDKTLAPDGKTLLIVMMPSDYDYWKNMGSDRATYKAKKEEIGNSIVKCLEQRFPGITELVEMIDIATPLTFEKYTGNWKGSFEGWLITPENANVLMKPMPQTLPLLKNFYMCGQWVSPGGGLPTSIMSGRRLIKSVCKEDRKKFVVAYDNRP